MPPTPKTKKRPAGGRGERRDRRAYERGVSSRYIGWRRSAMAHIEPRREFGDQLAGTGDVPPTLSSSDRQYLGWLPQPTAAVASPVDAQGAMAASAVAWLGADLMNAITKGCGGDGARSVE